MTHFLEFSASAVICETEVNLHDQRNQRVLHGLCPENCRQAPLYATWGSPPVDPAISEIFSHGRLSDDTPSAPSLPQECVSLAHDAASGRGGSGDMTAGDSAAGGGAERAPTQGHTNP